MLLPAPVSASAARGVNLDGWLVGNRAIEHAQRFAGDADLARLVNWRFTHARLPFDIHLLDTAEGWQALDWAISACARNGLQCVLALRLPPASTESGADHQINQATLCASEDTWRPFIQCWEAIATRYEPWSELLLYDLLDEPNIPDDLPQEALNALGAIRLSPAAARRPQPPGSTAGRAWSALAAKVTEAIRAVDTRPAIVVESPRQASPEAFRFLRPTRDAHTHYSFHFFEPEALTKRGEGTYPGPVAGERWDRERLKAAVEPALEFARAHEKPLYIGAFGAGDLAPRQARLTWVRSVLSLCRTYNLGWAYWTYRFPGFGLIGNTDRTRDHFSNPAGVDYDLLGVLQSEG